MEKTSIISRRAVAGDSCEYYRLRQQQKLSCGVGGKARQRTELQRDRKRDINGLLSRHPSQMGLADDAARGETLHGRRSKAVLVLTLAADKMGGPDVNLSVNGRAVVEMEPPALESQDVL